MSGEPISLQELHLYELLNHVREEARDLSRDAIRFASRVESWLPHFEPDHPVTYSADEDDWSHLYGEDTALD